MDASFTKLINCLNEWRESCIPFWTTYEVENIIFLFMCRFVPL